MSRLLRRRFYYVAALLVVALFSRCVIADSNTEDQPTVAALSVVSPKTGQSSILLGTMHAIVPGLREPDADSFADLKHIYTEHEVTFVQPESGSTLNTPALWASGLTDTQLRTYYSRAACAKVSREKAASYLQEPTDIHANLIAWTLCNVPDSPWWNWAGRDGWITLVMKKAGAESGYLESIPEIEKARQGVPTWTTTHGFTWALDHDVNQLLFDAAKALNQGNYDDISKLLDESVGNPESAAAINKTMVVGRNQLWLPRLQKIFDEGSALVVVGAAHLPGKDGLIRQLKQRGYTVTSILLPAQH